MTRYESAAAFRSDLLESGLLSALPVDGLYARSREFEAVVRGVAEHAAYVADGAERQVLTFPAVMPRQTYESTDYVRSFPDLLGSVSVFHGGDAEHAALIRTLDKGDDWAAHLGSSQMTLCSAACHQVYGLITGTLPAGGLVIELESPVFRHEPSTDPTRMVSFHMHEIVYLGTPEDAGRQRDVWLSRGQDALRELGLSPRTEVANDPFFGRPAPLLANQQRAEELKFELVVDITAERPTAIASANRHLDHFGAAFDIRTADGAVAHSTCFAFGNERVALALFALHGFQTEAWPQHVRKALSLDA